MFRKLLTLDEAKKTICINFKAEPLGFEEVALLQAFGRVLAEDAKAGQDVPPFDRSTVDGYAVLAEDTFEADENKPITLEVCGSLSIGQVPHVSIGHCKAAEIVTGAPIPQGANAVVMVEDTERHESTVRIYSAVAHGENIMKKSSDIRKGTIALRKKRLLQASEIGVLASIGLARVKVYVQPVVAVLSSGGEIIEPGKKLPAARIYDINAYSLSAAVIESGGKPLYLGVLPDDKSRLHKALKGALTSANVIVTSGGVSVGPKDIMPEVVSSLGKPGIIVSGIAIKPGKPVTVAIVEGKLFFCLPGHPTSALLIFHLLVHPVIRALAGRESSPDPTIRALAGAKMFPAKGRRTFVMVKLKKEADNWVATPVETGQSGAITTLANAEGFIEIAENQQFIYSGEQVMVRLLRSLPRNSNSTFYGSSLYPETAS
jgi:molybdenum cofactor synthesis domain-containing protein